MNYEKMDDFEINTLIAEILWLNWYCAAGDSPTGGWEYCCIPELMINDDSRLKDYCNNPADAWPIILVNEISITKYADLDEWEVYGRGICVDYDHCIISESGCSYRNNNPLRAAMIVFLMMHEKSQ